MEIQKKAGQTGQSSKGPAAKDDRYSVWKNVVGDGENPKVIYTVNEKKGEKWERAFSLNAEIGRTELTPEQVLGIANGRGVKVTGKNEKGRPYTMEVSLVGLKEVPREGQGGQTYLNVYAELGKASYRVGNDGQQFGYSLSIGRSGDGGPTKARFLDYVHVGNDTVKLDSADCWKLFKAGVDSPVAFGEEVELTLTALEPREEENEKTGEKYTVLFASVRGRYIEQSQEQSEAPAVAAEVPPPHEVGDEDLDVPEPEHAQGVRM